MEISVIRCVECHHAINTKKEKQLFKVTTYNPVCAMQDAVILHSYRPIARTAELGGSAVCTAIKKTLFHINCTCVPKRKGSHINNRSLPMSFPSASFDFKCTSKNSISSILRRIRRLRQSCLPLPRRDYYHGSSLVSMTAP